MPFHVTFPPLDALFDKFFGVPFLPLPAGVLALLVPWMWYLALPAQMTFVIGDPVDARDLLRGAGVADHEHPDRAGAARAACAMRHHMQRELDQAVAAHGKRPYDWRSMLHEWRHAGSRLSRVLPTGWPLSFVRHDRDRRREPARNRWHAIVRDLDLLAFYLPFGWPLLSLMRHLRRPPYGYRGLTAAESAERQGAFAWSLAARPLPPRSARSRPPTAVPMT